MSFTSTLAFGLYYQSAIMPPFTSVVPSGEGEELESEEGDGFTTEQGVPIVEEG